MNNLKQLELFTLENSVGFGGGSRGRNIFLKGPSDWRGLGRAGRLPGRALHVAVVLHLLAGMRKCATVRLGRTYMEQMGVDRHAQYRALRVLEKAGLVSVSRKRGGAPLVTIVPAEEASP